MKHFILHVPQTDGITVSAKVVNGRLIAKIDQPSHAAVGKPGDDALPAASAAPKAVHCAPQSNFWGPPSKLFVPPKEIGHMVDVARQCGLPVAAYIATGSPGGVGHLYLPQGIAEGRIFRPAQRFLCSSRKYLYMPKYVMSAQHLSCKACTSLLRSIVGEDAAVAVVDQRQENDDDNRRNDVAVYANESRSSKAT